MTKNSTSSNMLERAYTVKSSDDVKRLYRDWADTYDEHLESGLGYRAPLLLLLCFLVSSVILKVRF